MFQPLVMLAHCIWSSFVQHDQLSEQTSDVLSQVVSISRCPEPPLVHMSKWCKRWLYWICSLTQEKKGPDKHCEHRPPPGCPRWQFAFTMLPVQTAWSSGANSLCSPTGPSSSYESWCLVGLTGHNPTYVSGLLWFRGLPQHPDDKQCL